MASLLLKTKVDARFKLDYLKDFDQNILSWLGQSWLKDYKEILEVIPS